MSEDLYEYRTRHPEVVLLQYVDDLMLAGTTDEACSRATGDLFQTLGTLGYHVSAKKAQISRQEVTYLGYKIRQGATVADPGHEGNNIADTRAQDPPPGERVFGDCWIL